MKPFKRIRRVLASTLVLAAGLSMAAALCAEQAQYGPAMNYMLHCQGCHMEDGSGRDQFVPTFRDNVSRFVNVEGGRTFLIRVPGVTQSLLNDQERADVLNWILRTFDPRHLPPDFEPFTASELSEWRHDALSDPLRVRSELLMVLDSAAPVGASTAPELQVEIADATGQPPASFRLCLACHTNSADASNGMGPNLHGVVGRRVGSVDGFNYSPVMSASETTWTLENLDAFLESPARSMPGNFMVFPGMQDDDQRRSIIEYLSTTGREKH